MINKDRKIKQLDIVFENCESCTLALKKLEDNYGIY